MQCHSVSLELPDEPVALVVRPRPRPSGGTDPQVLLFFEDCIHNLEISEQQGSVALLLQLGPRLELVDAATGDPYAFTHAIRCGAYDPLSRCVCFFEGCALMRLDEDNAVSLVAGDKEEYGSQDGTGPQASRFFWPFALWPDCAGSMLAAQEECNGDLIRKVTMECGTVTTVRCLGVDLSHCFLFGYHTPRKQPLVATRSALYGVQPDGEARLIAGCEGYHVNRDGAGADARFRRISGLVVPPGSDSAYLVDHGALRRMDLRTGDVSTLAGLDENVLAGIPDDARLALLPQAGWLAVIVPGNTNLCLARIDALLEDEAAARSFDAKSGSGGSCGSSSGTTAAAGWQEGGQQADLLWPLLVQSRGGVGQVVVSVGRAPGQLFSAHRGVLSQRSAYFRGLLEGGFKEGDSAEVELPDVDPECFGPLLGYMYTGLLGDVPEERLRPMAELAGRLLLGEVSAQLTRRLLAVCTPACMLADLVWAERHGLRDLVMGLRARVMREYRRVMEATPVGVLSQLMVESPDFMAELMRAAALGPGRT